MWIGLCLTIWFGIETHSKCGWSYFEIVWGHVLVCYKLGFWKQNSYLACARSTGPVIFDTPIFLIKWDWMQCWRSLVCCVCRLTAGLGLTFVLQFMTWVSVMYDLMIITCSLMNKHVTFFTKFPHYYLRTVDIYWQSGKLKSYCRDNVKGSS